MNETPAAYMNRKLVEGLNENSLELALKALNAGVWSWVAGSDSVSWNDISYSLFDQPIGPVSLDTWMSKIHDEDQLRVSEMWERIPAKEGWFEMEFRINITHGIRWIRLSGYFIPATEDIPDHATGVMVDITEEKYFNQKLKDANFTKDKFFSIIAHDLRSPFTSILGFSRLLNEEYDDFSDDDRKMMIKQILSSTESTFQLLDNLLTWARSQLGRTTFNPETFEIENLIVETLNQSIPQAKIKGITLKALVSEKTNVMADMNMIRTVLRNLISNAIKFSYEGSVVNVEAVREKERITVSIKDTGTGIEPKTLNALFSLDEKVTSVKGTANEKGTGLGLILCKEFIEKNGGSIAVTSKVGEGSKFSFCLPVR